MSSLRSRLGGFVTAGALLVTLVAAVAITVERWQEENSSLANSVELSAFQYSATSDPVGEEVVVAGGADPFALVFDSGGGVLDQRGSVSPDLLDTILEDIWADATEQDTAITFEYDNDGDTGLRNDTRLAVSGVACVDQNVCDSVVVGVAEARFIDYALDRWVWLVAPVFLAALIALVSSRWLVGRSLRPVEAMRDELQSITASDLDRRVSVPSTGDELERLGETLNETITRLGGALSANERFAADAAHELRSPIAGARAALEVEASQRPGGMLDDSIDELDRAARLIDDLLVLARGQAEPAAFRDVDLDDIVRQELAGIAQRLPNVDIGRRIEAVRLQGDPDSLRRVVANLLENACRYGAGTLAISLESVGTVCRLTVDDDGPGVAPADRERIFERFARVDVSRARSTGGSGLGLAIVREIVLAHGGSVAVDESPVGGARFVVSIPLSESGYDYHVGGSDPRA